VRWIVYEGCYWVSSRFDGRVPPPESQPFFGINTDELAGLGLLACGLWIAIPCTLIAGVLIVYEVICGSSLSLSEENDSE
jgi:hypothetical protein